MDELPFLTGVDVGIRPNHYRAVWTFPGGRVRYVTLPRTVTNDVEAWIYALDHYPEWSPV